MNKAARDWCFTWWIPEDEDYRSFCCAISYGDYPEHISYMVQQLECKDGKRYHWQGYLELKKPMRLTQLKTIFGDDIHWEIRRGTKDEARNYCMKEESAVRKFIDLDGSESEFKPEEDGEFKRQGKRTDLLNVYEDIKEGKDLYDIITRNPVQYIKFHRGIERMKMIVDIKNNDKKFRNVEVTWISGKPGIGKTRRIYEMGNVAIITKPHSTLWFDNYIDQEILLIDDFDKWIEVNTLLHLLDGYEHHLPIKGGFVRAKYTKVFITANQTFDEMYLGHQQYDALKRRIHKFENL